MTHKRPPDILDVSARSLQARADLKSACDLDSVSSDRPLGKVGETKTREAHARDSTVSTKESEVAHLSARIAR